MMMFECKTCYQVKDRSGFHRDRKAKHGIKIFRCRDCYKIAGGKERETEPLTADQTKLLNRWLFAPVSSRVDGTHKWGYDCVVSFSKPERV
jgi:hypothetical protein